MVREAEENAEEDKKTKQRVEARNQLESYLYSLRTSVDDTLKDAIAEADKASIRTAIKDALAWLEEHQTDDKDAYDEKRKEVEVIANPIITKAYQSQGGAPQPTNSAESEPTTDDSSGPHEEQEPTVEDMDED
jgi:heat shock protein 5